MRMYDTWHNFTTKSERKKRQAFANEVKQAYAAGVVSPKTLARRMDISLDALARIEYGYVDPTHLYEKFKKALQQETMTISL